MTWDYAEATRWGVNGQLDRHGRLGLQERHSFRPAQGFGAQAMQTQSVSKVVSTDPPYYDNMRVR